MIFRLLQRQIFKELLGIFFVCLGAVLMVLLIGRLLQMSELMMGQSISFFDLAILFVYLSPFFLSLLIPVSCMLAIFLTFLRMGTDRELIALRAGGLSVYRFLPGPLVFVVLGMFCCGVMTMYGISWGMDHFRETIYDLARTKTTLQLQPGVFNNDFPGLTIFAHRIDPATGSMQDVFVEDVTNPEAQTAIVAPSGKILTNPDKGEMFFVLSGGKIYRYGKDGTNEISFETYRVKMDLSKVLAGTQSLDAQRIHSLSMNELRTQIAQWEPGKKQGEERLRDLKTELYKRYALPVACIVLGLFAIPLAFLFQGMHRQYGLVLVLGFFMFYYSLFSLGLVLAETGGLTPVIAMWMPNIVFVLLTGLGFFLVAWEKDIRIKDPLSCCRALLGMKGRRVGHEK
ncbi:MAG: LPS export ABC transporter permease LptF [Desulfoplanes sp.]